MKLPERQINEILTKIAINSVYGVLMFEKEEEPMPTNIPNDFIFKLINNGGLIIRTRRQINMQRIKKVIFNDPATIVFWSDGTKTVVKCDERDEFDPEKGLAMAICKKHFGGGFYNDIFKKWIPEEDAPVIEIDGQITMNEIAEKFEHLAKAAKSVFGPWDD